MDTNLIAAAEALMAKNGQPENTKPKTGKPRGFAALSVEKRKEISSLGGLAVPPEKRSFSRNRLLARTAGKKGGQAMLDAARALSVDPELASKAGAISGKMRGAGKAPKPGRDKL